MDANSIVVVPPQLISCAVGTCQFCLQPSPPVVEVPFPRCAVSPLVKKRWCVCQTPACREAMEQSRRTWLILPWEQAVQTFPQPVCQRSNGNLVHGWTILSDVFLEPHAPELEPSVYVGMIRQDQYIAKKVPWLIFLSWQATPESQ